MSTHVEAHNCSTSADAEGRTSHHFYLYEDAGLSPSWRTIPQTRRTGTRLPEVSNHGTQDRRSTDDEQAEVTPKALAEATCVSTDTLRHYEARAAARHHAHAGRLSPVSRKPDWSRARDPAGACDRVSLHDLASVLHQRDHDGAPPCQHVRRLVGERDRPRAPHGRVAHAAGSYPFAASGVGSAAPRNATGRARSATGHAGTTADASEPCSMAQPKAAPLVTPDGRSEVDRPLLPRGENVTRNVFLRSHTQRCADGTLDSVRKSGWNGACRL